MNDNPTQSSPGREIFSSRWGLIFAALGMAIGTGNIWRFPRILAETGGGAFLIPWALFLVTWSIPLLMVEFAVGRGSGRGPVGAFARIFGKGTAFLGMFVAFCTAAIMFYYSVVAGWCLRYLVQAVTEGFSSLEPSTSTSFFTEIASGPSAVVYHGIAVALAAVVVIRGVKHGIEKVSKFLIPSLLVLVVISMIRVLQLPDSGKGLSFMFEMELSDLSDVELWLQGLTQSAWSTGAGWGLLLVYAVYAPKSQRVGPSCAVTGFGNNIASFIAALAVIPAVFALMPLVGGYVPEEELTKSGPASTGVTFVWVPILFEQMGGGRFFSILFFLALSVAAISSLIAMIELATRVVMDLGLARSKAVIGVALVSFTLGVPSALSMSIFANQDWVWAVGLILSGGFLAFGVVRYGVRRFRKEHLPGTGAWFDFVFGILIPLEFLGLLTWWFIQAFQWTDGEGRGFGERLWLWLDPTEAFSVGTCLAQWAVILVLARVFNRSLARRSLGGES